MNLFMKSLMKQFQKPSFITFITSIILLLVGCICITISIIGCNNLQNEHWYRYLFAFMETIGITIISFALVTIILDFKSWKDYFSHIIQDILQMDSYLHSLDKARLDELLVSLLKAKLGNDKIDEKGTFFWHFKDDLLKYITEPYRENVRAHIHIETITDNLRIKDIVTYDLYKNNCDFPQIKWSPDKNEFEEIESLKFYINNSLNKVYEKKEISEIIAKNEYPIVNIQKTNNEDVVHVKIESCYLIKSDKFQYWQMMYPSKNFTFSASFSQEYSIQVKPFVLNENDLIINEDKNSYELIYNNWMLPYSGIAWSFKRGN